jgi:hypothetical protein
MGEARVHASWLVTDVSCLSLAVAGPVGEDFKRAATLVYGVVRAHGPQIAALYGREASPWNGKSDFQVTIAVDTSAGFSMLDGKSAMALCGGESGLFYTLS